MARTARQDPRVNPVRREESAPSDPGAPLARKGNRVTQWSSTTTAASWMHTRALQVPQGRRARRALQAQRESWACQVHLDWMEKRVPKELRVTKAVRGSQDRKERREKWAYRVHREQMGQKERKETPDHRVCRTTTSSRSQDRPDCPAPWVLQESRGLKAWMVQREKKVTAVRRGSAATQAQLVSLVPQGSLAYPVPKEKRESQESRD